MPIVEFNRVSYDSILRDLTSSYLEEHPSVPFHEVIDIIRPKADRDYLDQIARNFTQSPNTTKSCSSTESKPKTIIYLDRNNTPDIWEDIRRTVEFAG